jgi:endothelin-converting enzyme
MADCVVAEYNAFRPLPQLGIDGEQTLGENIADSGGLQAAYRAFQGYASLYGPDPHLPDSVYQWFSHDQLFFLSFAQTWCQVPYPDRALERQL